MKRALVLALLSLAACSHEAPPAPAPGPAIPEHHFDCTTWQTHTATPEGDRRFAWGPPFMYDPLGSGPDPRTKTYGTPPPPSKWEAECKGNARCVFLPLKAGWDGRFEDGQPFRFHQNMGRVEGFARTSATFSAEVRVASNSDGIGVPHSGTTVDAHEGDLVPTLWGAARVIRVFPPISKSVADAPTGYVQLHILGEGDLARYTDANRVFVGPGLRTTLGGDQIFMDWRDEGTPTMNAQLTALNGPQTVIPRGPGHAAKGAVTGDLIELWGLNYRVLAVQKPNEATRGWIELRTVPE